MTALRYASDDPAFRLLIEASAKTFRAPEAKTPWDVETSRDDDGNIVMLFRFPKSEPVALRLSPNALEALIERMETALAQVDRGA